MVVIGVQPRAPLYGIHGFHTCYLSLYVSNEFAALKETILLLFVLNDQSWLTLFDLLGRNVDCIAGEMQVFENFAAEA